MKHIAFLLITIFTIACSSGNEATTEENSPQVVESFLDDIDALKDVQSKNPILLFASQANDLAEEKLSLNKDNMGVFLERARQFKHCVIVIGDHTIVKISDFEDCAQSGSWATCMPKAEGFVKKGDLVEQNDYINNIIGRPDSQKRTGYLFN